MTSKMAASRVGSVTRKPVFAPQAFSAHAAAVAASRPERERPSPMES
ncbi:MAG: hypothetical protein U0269_03385 [Polyangiales bacterium]